MAEVERLFSHDRWKSRLRSDCDASNVELIAAWVMWGKARGHFAAGDGKTTGGERDFSAERRRLLAAVGLPAEAL